MKRNAGSFIKCIEGNNPKLYIPVKIRNELALEKNDLIEVSIRRVKTVLDS